MKNEDPDNENEFRFDTNSINPLIQKAESLNLSQLPE